MWWLCPDSCWGLWAWQWPHSCLGKDSGSWEWIKPRKKGLWNQSFVDTDHHHHYYYWLWLSLRKFLYPLIWGSLIYRSNQDNASKPSPRIFPRAESESSHLIGVWQVRVSFSLYIKLQNPLTRKFWHARACPYDRLQIYPRAQKLMFERSEKLL